MSDVRILGKAELLSGELLHRELVKIPERGIAVWMRKMNAEHVIEFKRIIDGFKKDGVKSTTLEQDREIMTAVISFSACDENGQLLFSSPDEASGLVVNDFNLLMDLGNKALELSNIKISNSGFTSEVAADLPNDQMNSSLEGSRKSSRKRARKS